MRCLSDGYASSGWRFCVEALAEVVATRAHLKDAQLLYLARQPRFAIASECVSELASECRPSLDELGRI